MMKKPKQKKDRVTSELSDDDDDGASTCSSTMSPAARGGIKSGNKRKSPRRTRAGSRKRTACIDESEEASSAVESPRARSASKRGKHTGGTRKRARLMPGEHASASVAKYVAILSIAQMPRTKKREVLELVLLTESDEALKAVIEDSLADDMDFHELATILQEAVCICSDDD
jgi:hypothetical protein